jgi:hypothetical protein
MSNSNLAFKFEKYQGIVVADNMSEKWNTIEADRILRNNTAKGLAMAACRPIFYQVE